MLTVANKVILASLLSAAVLTACAFAQAPTSWMSEPSAATAHEKGEPIALQFKREFSLQKVPSQFPVYVSADNRFILYVNGKRIADGPSRGDLGAWRYETIDLAPHLKRGGNVVAAQVWSDGKAAPLAQITAGPAAFLIAAADAAQSDLIGDVSDWSVRIDESRTVSAGMPSVIQEVGQTFYASGGPEIISAKDQLDSWSNAETANDSWGPAAPLSERATPLRMVADALPQMKYEKISSGRVVRTEGVDPGDFPSGPVEIPAHSEVSILVDAGRVLAAYPALVTSGGAGATISATYTEALYKEGKTEDDSEFSQSSGVPQGLVRFADRSRVDDGLVRGLSDTYLPDGRKDRILRPFWWRAWRFVEFTIRTADEPLTLERFDTYETGYPFETKGRFVSDDEELNEIWRIGWTTALFDAHETYMDTAYWEQLQYIGDTRIQMLLSYDVAGDKRLAIQALDAVNHSRNADGLPQAAWPQLFDNVIPPFALLWIGSLHDYWTYQTEYDVIERNLQGTREILDWYAENVSKRGIVKESSGWPFVDWVGHLDGWAWRGGKAPEHCVISMLYYGALHQAAALEMEFGDAELSPVYLDRASDIKDALYEQCWDADRNLFADTPAKKIYSQHAAILSVLYDIIPGDEQQAMLERVMDPSGGIGSPEGILPSTYYFSFYLAKALDHAGMTDRYLSLLTPWRKMLAQNFTTWPETPDPARSDSHAWSGHPTAGLLTYVAGVQPATPGFGRVKIEPHLGHLTSVDAAMAHPGGLIETKYKVKKGKLRATITLPPGLSGTFIWNGEEHDLKGGKNKLSLRVVSD